MIKDYKPSYRKEITYFERQFMRIGDNEPCLAFPVNEDGDVSLNNPRAKENFDFAVAHPETYKDLGNVKIESSCLEPAAGTCHCGNHIELINQYLGACECPKCGQWYNLFGQELVNPEYWDEDDDPEDAYGWA